MDHDASTANVVSSGPVAVDTVCSAHPSDSGCGPRETYFVHNVVGDISDPYNPVEVARYNETGPDFEQRNGGIQDIWGIYKKSDSPWSYASDRNGGLYVREELGSGSEKEGRDGDDRGRS